MTFMWTQIYGDVNDVLIISLLIWFRCECPCIHAMKNTDPYRKANNLALHWLGSLSYHGVIMSHVQQVHTSLSVCEGSYPQAVGRMKLLHEEAAADLDDLRKLQETRCCQQTLDGFLFQLKDTWDVMTKKKCPFCGKKTELKRWRKMEQNSGNGIFF